MLAKAGGRPRFFAHLISFQRNARRPLQAAADARAAVRRVLFRSEQQETN
jgi:hypothetical protein